MLDIFSNDAFSVTTLTEAMQVLPYNQSRLSQLGLFQDEPITTTDVAIENKGGLLSLIPSQVRGARPETSTQPKRTIRKIGVPHFPKDDAVMADEVQNVRAFGSDDATEAVASVVNNKLTKLKQDHEITAEWHRLGAITGQLLDADGTTVLLNLFTEYNVTETSITFVPATVNDMMLKSLAVKRAIETALNGMAYTGIRALCSPEFFDAFVTSADVKTAFQMYQESFASSDNRKGFTYAGITWEEYSLNFGATRGIAANRCRFVVEGLPGLFKRFNAPAPFMETVNTPGLPYYSKTEPMPLNMGVTLHTQSNHLHMCVVPATLIRGTL